MFVKGHIAVGRAVSVKGHRATGTVVSVKGNIEVSMKGHIAGGTVVSVTRTYSCGHCGICKRGILRCL